MRGCIWEVSPRRRFCIVCAVMSCRDGEIPHLESWMGTQDFQELCLVLQQYVGTVKLLDLCIF